MKRILIAVILILGFAATANAGMVTLPATLDQLLIPGNYAVVGPEPDTFSAFGYSTSPVGIAPLPQDVTVSEFHAGIENGLTFSGAFATTGSTVDYVIKYTVTAPTGDFLTDAYSSAVWNVLGGTGVGSIGETFTNAANGAVLGTLSLTSPDPGPQTINFGPGVTSILVEKDVLLFGGDKGIGVTVINQGISSTSVPEPNAALLLGIPISVFLLIRRLSRRG